MHVTPNTPMQALLDTGGLEMFYDPLFRRGQAIVEVWGTTEENEDEHAIYCWVNTDADGIDVLIYMTDAFKRDINIEPLARVLLEYHKGGLQLLTWPKGTYVDDEPAQVQRLASSRQLVSQDGQSEPGGPLHGQRESLQTLLDLGSLKMVYDAQDSRGKVAVEMRDQAKAEDEKLMYGLVDISRSGVDMLVFAMADQEDLHSSPLVKVTLRFSAGKIRLLIWRYGATAGSDPAQVVPLADFTLLGRREELNQEKMSKRRRRSSSGTRRTASPSTASTMVIGPYTFERADILGPQLRLIPFQGDEQLWTAHYGEVSDGNSMLSLTIELLFIAHLWQFRIRDDDKKILIWKGNKRGEETYKGPDQVLEAAVRWIKENYSPEKLEQ